MRQAVVVGTFDGREEWLEPCLNSLKDSPYEIFVVNNPQFELSHIQHAFWSGYDEFLYLHDTCEVKNIELLSIVLEEKRGFSVALSDYPVPFGMYLGKYRAETLEKLVIPIPTSKQEAVEREITWTQEYIEADEEKTVIMTPPLHDGSNFVTIRGKTYMKLENDYLIKYKGTWNRNML